MQRNNDTRKSWTQKMLRAAKKEWAMDVLFQNTFISSSVIAAQAAILCPLYAFKVVISKCKMSFACKEKMREKKTGTYGAAVASSQAK